MNNQSFGRTNQALMRQAGTTALSSQSRSSHSLFPLSLAQMHILRLWSWLAGEHLSEAVIQQIQELQQSQFDY